MSFRTLDDLDDGQRALARLDLNSPVEDGEVQDNRRFERHARTVRELLDADHAVALMAHQGRPGRDDFMSLRQHAAILSEHVGAEVAFVDDVHDDRALDAVGSLDGGEALLLENVRMSEEELPERSPEEHADSEFVRSLSAAVDCYVGDAYSAAHRSHASIVGFPKALPAYAGRVMETEYEANSAIATREFDGDVTMVVGGTKVTDVVEVMSALDERVDTFLVGGVAGELFLRARGHEVGFDVAGTDRFDEQWERNRDTVEAVLDERGDSVVLPRDFAYEADGERAEVALDDVDRKDRAYLDVGARTVDAFRPVVEESAAVFVKGALGVFEDERFADGTVGVLKAIAAADCFSVVGGGDTSRAIELYGLEAGDFSHISIAGGAYIRALTGAPLPGVELLRAESA